MFPLCFREEWKHMLPLGLSETRNFVLIWTVFTDTRLLGLAFLKGRRKVECKRGKNFQSTFGSNLHTTLEKNEKKEKGAIIITVQVPFNLGKISCSVNLPYAFLSTCFISICYFMLVNNGLNGRNLAIQKCLDWHIENCALLFILLVSFIL